MLHGATWPAGHSPAPEDELATTGAGTLKEHESMRFQREFSSSSPSWPP